MYDGIITLAALGRPFSLGMLYDCRSDQLVPGVTLWNAESLKEHVSTQSQENSSVQILTSDTIQTKTESLDVHGGLKLSVLGGLFSVSGSGQYFHDHQSQSEVARVTLKSKAMSHFKQLSMNHLASQNITYPAVFDNGLATHVVCGIEYGCDAYLIFEKKVEKSDRKRNIQGELEGVVQMVAVQVSASAGVNLGTQETENTENINCKFYGDFRPDTIPTTYKDAVAVMQNLSIKLKSVEAVPKVVHLYPLALLDSRAAKLVREISEHLVDNVQNFFQLLSDLKLKVTAITNQKTASCCVPFISDQMAEFQRTINLTNTMLQKCILPILPRIRGGGAEESELVNVLESWEKSAYDPMNIGAVVKKAEQNIAIIESYLKACEKNDIKIAFDAELEDILADVDTSKAVCFTLNSFVVESKGLKSIRKQIGSPKPSLFENPKEWFDQERQKTELHRTFKLFMKYAELNQTEGVRFIFAEAYKEDHLSPGYVQVYKDGTSEVVNLPLEPEEVYQPSPSEIAVTSVKLSWKKPQNATDSIKGYKISMKETESSNEVHLTVSGCEGTMSDLKPGKKYKSTVQTISLAGVSPKSAEIEIQLQQEDRLAVTMLSRSNAVQDKVENVEIYCPKDKIGNPNEQVRRYAIGLPRKGLRIEKTILVVGATGTGKTTFLNSLTNYLFQVQPEDDFRFKIVTQADEGKESAKSVTKHVTAYVINESCKKYALTVVDTPGYGDTEGLDADKHTTKLIKELFERQGSGVDRLDAVCIVVKATDTRLTAQQRHNFNSVLSLFGKDMKNNIIIVATFADASKPPVELALKEAKMPYAKLLKFNNSAIFEKITSDNRRAQEFYWEIAQDNFKEFFEFLETMNPVSLSLTNKVLTYRESLENYVISLQKLVSDGLNSLDEMRQECFILEQHAADIQANRSFEYTVKQVEATPKYVPIPAGRYFTTCLQCNRTCHDSCCIEDDDQKRGCVAMKGDGYCEICENAGKTCFWNLHKNQPFLYEYKEIAKTRTDEDLKAKYSKAKEDFVQKDAMMEELGKQFALTEMRTQELIKNINSALTELKKIALKPDPLTDEEYIDILIEAEKYEHQPGWHERVKGLERQKRIASQLKHVQSPDFNPFNKSAVTLDDIFEKYADTIPFKDYSRKKKGWFAYAKDGVKAAFAKLK